jgi:hypothetical protein
VVLGACLSQVFRAWHSPLLRFLIASAVFAPCGLSSLFHLVTLLGFSFRAFSCKRLVASSCAILSRLEAPSALYRWLLHAHDFVLAAFIAFESQRCSSILGASTLLQLVRIGSVVSRLRWSMLSWFSLLFRGSFLCLRSSCDDLHRCNTSVTSPTLTVYNKLAFSSAFALVFCSLLLVGSTVRLLAPPLPLRLVPLTFAGSPHHSLASSLLPPLLTVASFLLRPLALRRFVPTA